MKSMDIGAPPSACCLKGEDHKARLLSEINGPCPKTGKKESPHALGRKKKGYNSFVADDEIARKGNKAIEYPRGNRGENNGNDGLKDDVEGHKVPKGLLEIYP
jgi:hypothetical protein